MSKLANGEASGSRVTVVADSVALAAEGARRFVEVSREAIAARGRFSVALSGGSTPRAMYQRIAESHAKEIAWDKVHVWWGDERCVAWDHPDSNARMAGEALLTRVAIPAANVHRVPVVGRTPEVAAEEYERELRAFARSAAPFDLVLLGLGADGHTASLFPGSVALRENNRWVVSTQAPPASPVKDRVTITFAAIAASEHAVFLVAGAEKREMLRRCLESARVDEEQAPAERVRARNGVEWIVDRAAAGDFHA